MGIESVVRNVDVRLVGGITRKRLSKYGINGREGVMSRKHWTNSDDDYKDFLIGKFLRLMDETSQFEKGTDFIGAFHEIKEYEDYIDYLEEWVYLGQKPPEPE